VCAAVAFESERVYFAYGSNLHPLRMIDRLGSDIRLLGTSQVDGYRLEFCKRSATDGSAKCTITSSQGRSIWGAVYAITHAQKQVLDRFEGLGNGYDEKLLMLNVAGERLQAFTYTANWKHIDKTLEPYCWYKALVCAGARHHQFPEEYIAAVDKTPFVVDPDPARKLKNENVLALLGTSGPSRNDKPL
jgi:gamma-glutamylcyclotransferase